MNIILGEIDFQAGISSNSFDLNRRLGEIELVVGRKRQGTYSHARCLGIGGVKGANGGHCGFLKDKRSRR